MSESATHDLSKTPLHLPTVEPGGAPVQVMADFNFDGPSWERYVTETCNEQDPGRIMMIESTPADWGGWECHTLGDEIVFVLEGRGTFHQEFEDGVRQTEFGPGDCIINPAGVWHTADVTEPMRAIYVTPAPGTEHRPR